MSVEAITWALRQDVQQSSAKFVLVVLANCASADGDLAYPSVQYIATATSQDRKTVVANLKKLCDAGLISDSGQRVGQTKQVIVYRLNLRSEGMEKRNSSENGTVPKTEVNSTVFPHKQSRFSLETVPKTGHGTGKEPSLTVSKSNRQSSREDVPAEGFDEFWDAYPRKDGRKAAVKAWNKIKPSAELLAKILAALALQVKSAKWTEKGGQFIPYGSTYLNGERWLDPVHPPNQPAGKPPIAQRFADKTYHGTPDHELPDFLRTGTH